MTSLGLQAIPTPKAMEEARQSFFELYPLAPIRNDKDYDEYKKLLLELMAFKREAEPEIVERLTLGGEYLKHLAKVMKDYEESKFGVPKKVTGVKLLKFLMDQNGLTQSDFENEIGPQGNVSNILNGIRKLNVDQIRKLSKRFKISSDAFLAE